MGPKVFIIILNWNGKKDTLECLSSLNKISYKNYKIVLVDNGSKDNSAKEIKKNFPNVKIIHNRKNLGFAEGSNVGIRYALKNNADYVLLLNNDTIVDRKFLSEMMKVAESDKKIGIIGSKIYHYYNPDIIWQTIGVVDFKKAKIYSRDIHKKDNFNKIEEADYVSGCVMLIKRNVFDKIGLLDPVYFAYLEDVDFCIRCRKNGMRILYAPKSKVWHKISRSVSKGRSQDYFSPLRNYYLTRNLILFIKKNADKKDRILCIPAIISRILTSFLIILFKEKNKLKKVKAIRNAVLWHFANNAKKWSLDKKYA